MQSTINLSSNNIRIIHPFSLNPYSIDYKNYFNQISSRILNNTQFISQISESSVKNTPNSQICYSEVSIDSLDKCITQTPEPIYICGPCSSSMDIALSLVKKNIFPTWSSVIVTSQNTGRGQLGKQWASPPGNLYATIRIPLSPLFIETTASSALGAFIAHILNTMGIPIFLKWPNDLLIHTSTTQQSTWAKVGGILLEEYNDVLLVGIGINLISTPKYTQQKPIIKPTILPKPLHIQYSKNQILDIWIILVRELFLWYNISKQLEEDTTLWHTFAERYLAFKQEQVIIKDGAHEKKHHKGTLVGINKTNGGACLSISSKNRTFLSGSLYPL